MTIDTKLATELTVAASDEFDKVIAGNGPALVSVTPAIIRKRGREDEGIFCPSDYGTFSEGDDISEALQNCLDAAFAARVARVVMPGGNYLLNSQVVAGFPASGSGYPRHVVSLDFSGCGLTIPATNTTGGIKITKHNNFQCLNIHGVTIYSDHAYDGGTTAGDGLVIESSIGQGDAGWGAAGYSELFMSDIMVGTDRGAAEGRFNNGVIVKNIWYPRLHRVDAVTRYQYDLPDNGSFESGSGIRLDCCYSPELHACRATGKWDVGIELTDDDKPAFEFFSLIDCQSVNSRVAFLLDHTNAGWSADALKEPGGTLIGGHYNGAQSGIEVHHHQSFVVRDALVYLTNPDQGTALTTYSDGAYIRLVDCHEAHVTGNILNFGGHYTSDADCSSGIRLEGTTEKCLIDGNRIYHDGIGINNQATGSGNIVRGTVFDGRGPGSAGAPTKKYLDASNLLRGEVQTPGAPVIQFGGAAVGQSYATQKSGFTQEGRTVHWWVDITFSNKGSSTGAAVIITNFPNRDTDAVATAGIAWSTLFTTNAPQGVNVTAGGDLQLYYEAATGAMNSTVTDANFQNTSQLRMSGSYVAAV